jgi:hypothetical protein
MPPVVAQEPTGTIWLLPKTDLEHARNVEQLKQYLKRIKLKDFLKGLLTEFGGIRASLTYVAEKDILKKKTDKIAEWKAIFMSYGSEHSIEVIGFHTNKSELGSYEDLWNTILYSYYHMDDRLMYMKPIKRERAFVLDKIKPS